MAAKSSTSKPRLALTHSVPSLPSYCDYNCPYATFAPTDAVGACRREQAVYCTLIKKYNNKNARCIKSRSQ